MRRTHSAATHLYNFLFPNPTANDPPNFSAHLGRNLIPEIRVETARFYGSLDSVEARYPGLDYCHLPHRRRLSLFPHHANLFAAIDSLGLTDWEVHDLVRWEGTLWARERYERDSKTRVKDTTGDGIGPWIDPRPAWKAGRAIRVATKWEVDYQEAVPMPLQARHQLHLQQRQQREGQQRQQIEQRQRQQIEQQRQHLQEAQDLHREMVLRRGTLVDQAADEEQEWEDADDDEGDADESENEEGGHEEDEPDPQAMYHMLQHQQEQYRRGLAHVLAAEQDLARNVEVDFVSSTAPLRDMLRTPTVTQPAA